jgi:tetratricopeptide (TPR) repeat protein
MKCLEKDRARRYETANALAMDLARHLNNEPVTAAAPSAAYRAQKFIRRNTAALAVAGSMVLLLSAGLVVSTWQAVRATRAERQAKAEASKSQQVAQFLKDVLEGVGPSKAKGRDTTMLKEILEKTTERVGKDWKNQPEIEAELRSILGEVYRALGDYERAEEMQRKALDLWRKLFGNEHLEVARALTSLGLVVQSRQRPAEAESLQREAVAVFTRLLGDEHAEVATALNNLASALGDEGKLEEAERLHRRVVALRTRLLGPKHELLAGSLGNLGLVLQYEGRSAEAEPLLREAAAMLTELLGRENELVATELNNLALRVPRHKSTAGSGVLPHRSAVNDWIVSKNYETQK